MKVLIVADVLGDENNGTTIAAMNLVRYLKSQGDEVRILCSDQDKKGQEGFYIVPILHLGFIIDKIISKNNVTLSKANKKIIYSALNGVDIVHIMMPFSLGVHACKHARKLGIPITAGFHVQAENFTSHIGMMDIPLINRITYRHFYKKLYQHVDAVHYPTEFIRKLFESTVKRKTNAYVISNGVQSIYKKCKVKRIDELNKHFNILFIGRYSKEKSHLMLLDAVGKSKYKNNIQLIFAGQGPRENEIDKRVKKLGLIPPIKRFYTREELVEVINSSDLYVHPSEIEIEAISCLEAITCGLVPVINDSKRSATNAFALTEKNKFKNKDTTDLANKIDYWLDHPEEKEECAKQYLNFTKSYSQDECMKQMREMLCTYALNPLSHTSKKKRYYRDERNDDFANNSIETKHNKPGFKYLITNPLLKGVSFFLYYIFAKPIIYLINKCFYHQKIVNRHILKPYKKTGYFIYANHTSSAGDAFTPNLLSCKRNYIITSEDTTSITGLKTIVKLLGAIPLPSNYENYQGFYDAIYYHVVNKRCSITIYPEAHIWPTYTKIRNFSSSSFKYPYDLNVPCFVITNTYQRGKIFKKVRLISYVSGPFYPDKTLDRKDGLKKLRDDVYTKMIKKSTNVEQVERIRYIKIDK